MEIYKYNIYRPGGNDTALVETLVLDPVVKKIINDKIMDYNPNVEQVGFIDSKTLRLEMAGGEFCGNATRCAGYKLLGGLPGNIKINVSGVKQKLVISIDDQGKTWTQMPIYRDSKYITCNRDYSIVKMQGITHVIVKTNNEIGNKQILKSEGLKILKRLNLLDKYPASGVMFARNIGGRLVIDPIVWVRDIKTLFYESACASGTTALGLVESMLRQQNLNKIPVKQPSGENIFVSVNLRKNSFSNAYIGGPVKILKKNMILKI